MTPERYRRIGELYHSALEVSEGERAAFLERACAGDTMLRREVESLIASHKQGADFIAAPALSVAAEMLADSEADALTRQTIAHYRVQSLVGAGGMGRVYLAGRIGSQSAASVVMTISLARHLVVVGPCAQAISAYSLRTIPLTL